MAKKNSSFKKMLLAFIGVLALSGLITGYNLYKAVFLPNVTAFEEKNTFIYIPTGATFEEVERMLEQKNYLMNKVTFEWMAELLKYTHNIKPGKYQITAGMSNKDLLLLLRSGKQTPVRLTLNNIRTTAQLASVVSRELEADSSTLVTLLSNDELLVPYGHNARNVIGLFIPDTYEFYWNTSAEEFLQKMHKEYEKFWTAARRKKAKEIGLTPAEVTTMASIVEQETNNNAEKDSIAGVYMNRLKKGWKLEADPTLKFAAGDFSIRRILNVHKEIDSPYNTYMYGGLPPGPICMPSIVSIKAVLNYAHHDYFFFCARDNFSGTHCFAITYDQHKVNARKFHSELNKRNIK